MQLSRLVVALVAALALSAGAMVAVAQNTVTEADYDAAMKELRFLAGDVALHIDASYWGDLGEDTDKLRREFGKVETFWKAHEQHQAVDFVGQALEAVTTISRAAGAQDARSATAGLGELRSVCQACHAEFREETADGFRIKPSALR